MKQSLFLLFLAILTLSCQTKDITSPTTISKKFRTDLTKDEQNIIDLSKVIIQQCYFGTLITIDESGQPRARVMEPFAPDDDYIIWFGTNPRSRKVKQIQNNPKVTLHYFDKNNLGYISLMGDATIVNDEKIKSTKFKDGWDKFYKNQQEEYLLIKFVPNTLELISIPKSYTGDSITWKPHVVELRN